jgi:hypothetical protein
MTKGITLLMLFFLAFATAHAACPPLLIIHTEWGLAGLSLEKLSADQAALHLFSKGRPGRSLVWSKITGCAVNGNVLILT